MAKDDATNTDRLQLARQLVAHLEAGQESEAEDILKDLGKASGTGRDGDLFQEVGRLTRELHDAINGFMLDSKVAEMVEMEIPDAAERLRYVITTTEQAAHTTLNAIEAGLPLADKMKQDAKELNERWGRFRQREMDLKDFKALSSDIDEFLADVDSVSTELHSKLNEVLMAQGFQDITGQIIRKVITLVHEVEERLVQLVRIAGGRDAADMEQIKKERAAHEDGPVVPGVTQSEVVSSQDDVDDLLSSLGF